MLAQIRSAALHGVDSYPVTVEVNMSSGLPSFSVVGLPQGAVREGRDRVLAALAHVGCSVPPRRIVVNLAPADIRKGGSAFDLPIAVGLLCGMGKLPVADTADAAFVGELGLDGRLHPMRGALPVATGCLESGVRRLFLPLDNAREAGVVEGLGVFGISSLSQLLDHWAGRSSVRSTRVRWRGGLETTARDSVSDVRGQANAKRALEIAAAGGHNLILVGPPGAGKTMLVRRLPGLLPPLSLAESLETTRVHSVAGLIPPGDGLVLRRPFRAPHHSISVAGLVGGGTPPRPGEVSLAHNGVLFLDELLEFRSAALESLRQPLEAGSVAVARARYNVIFPARVQLACALNPCPCGYHGDGSDRCSCPPPLVARYRSRASGPLLDRIDLHVSVAAVEAADLTAPGTSDGAGPARERVARARRVQAERLQAHENLRTNAGLTPALVACYCAVGEEGRRLLSLAVDRMGLSARSYHRVLKVARSIADLDDSNEVRTRHLEEALHFRNA